MRAKVQRMLQALGAIFGCGPGVEYWNGVRPFYMTARPGFWGGFGSSLDVFSPFSWNYVNYTTREAADEAAMLSDWYALGGDLMATLDSVRIPELPA